MSELSTNRGENGAAALVADVSADALAAFYDHLLHQRMVPGDIKGRFNLSEARRTGKPLHRLWQVSGIPVHEFANDVARFFDVPRVELAELMAATPLADNFSERFLRELPPGDRIPSRSALAYESGRRGQRSVAANGPRMPGSSLQEMPELRKRERLQLDDSAERARERLLRFLPSERNHS